MGVLGLFSGFFLVMGMLEEEDVLLLLDEFEG